MTPSTRSGATAEFLTSEALAQCPGIAHGFFTRLGGVSGGVYASLNCGMGSRDHTDNIRENRARAANALGMDAGALRTVHQVHGAGVLTLRDPAPPPTPAEADALVTGLPGLALGVTYADCAPVLLADPKASVIGAAHAGWRGALAGILQSTVEAMEGLGAKTEFIIGAIGPCIQQASYEVGEELLARFLDNAGANEEFFAPAQRAHHYRFDLEGYVRNTLGALGVSRVDALELDTCERKDLFFSYRRETACGSADYGRHVALLSLAH